MPDSPASAVLPCMLANARAAEEALVRALADVRGAIAAGEEGNRNGVAGWLLDVDQQVEAALALVRAAKQLHRAAPLGR